MDIATILAKLTEEERTVIQTAIDAEKNTGIEAARKKGDEIKRWMTTANALRDALKAAELDPDSDIAEQIAALREKSGTKPKSDLEKQVITLSKQIELVNKQLAEKEQAAQASAEKYKITRLKQELGKSLSEKVHASDFVIEGLIRNNTVTLNDNDTVVWREGENEIDFKAGVDSFLKSNPAIVKNVQNPGSGSGGGASGSAKTMSRADFEKSAPADQMKFVKDGGKIV